MNESLSPRYRVNLDYERVLSGKTSSLSMNQELEYLIFFDPPASKYTLQNASSYGHAYWDFLDELSLPLPVLDPKKSESYAWWGEFRNSDLEKTLNSKASILPLLSYLGEKGQDMQVLTSEEEVKKWLAHHRGEVLFKPLFGMSGVGQCLAKGGGLQGPFPSLPCLAMPYFSRTLDIGVRAFKRGNILHTRTTLSQVDRRGQFKGSSGHLQEKKVLDLIERKIALRSQGRRWRQIQMKAIEYLFNHHPLESYPNGIQMDGLFYTQKNRQHFLPACELNLRRSMSDILFSSWLERLASGRWRHLFFLPWESVARRFSNMGDLLSALQQSGFCCPRDGVPLTPLEGGPKRFYLFLFWTDKYGQGADLFHRLRQALKA